MFDYTMNKYETLSLKYSHLSKPFLKHYKFRSLFSIVRIFNPNDFKNSLFFKVSELLFTVNSLSIALQLVMLG